MAKKNQPKPEKQPKPAKEKKGKNKKGKVDPAAAAPGVPPTGTPSAGGATTNGTQSVPLANMSPEQMTAAQIEQAIKESNDPNSKLKKLRSPLNVRSCLLNLLILIVATLGVVILWCFLVVDKFDFAVVMGDMMDKFGISSFFSNLGSTISGWFGG